MTAPPIKHWGRCLVCGEHADRDVCPDCVTAMQTGEALGRRSA